MTNYSDDKKLKIVKKFMRMKNDHSGKDKKSCKEMDKEIAEKFGVNVCTIKEWKNEFGLSRRKTKSERKNLVKKFDLMKAELTLAGFKNSYKQEIDEIIATKLGLSFVTIYAWKRKLGQSTPNHKYSHSDQNELMKRYYQIKDQHQQIKDVDIAKMLKIGRVTLYRWKKQFERQQLHPNSADGQSLEENAEANWDGKQISEFHPQKIQRRRFRDKAVTTTNFVRIPAAHDIPGARYTPTSSALVNTQDATVKCETDGVQL
ncbi:hypothetical protein GPALN_009775 [Globodera pallida]|nr:hypothetical protein GPALN_009775 [Globodera pallida]